MLRRAFTFVELLIVIGIIVLVMAILLPTIGRARKVAIRTALQADARFLRKKERPNLWGVLRVLSV